MSVQYTEGAIGTGIPGAAIAKYLRVKEVAGVLQKAGSTDAELGTLEEAAFGSASPAVVSYRFRNSQGTRLMIASEAITAPNEVYAAANGKVAASGTRLVGSARTSATADGDIIEVLPVGEASNATADGGTTASAFEVDSDSSTPKIALAGQTGGTGDFTTTLKPESTLSGDNAIIVPEADGDTLTANALAQSLTNKTLGDGTKDTRAAVSLTANTDSGAASSITAGVQQVTVAGVTNDANDWIVLPAIASVGIGHTIRIACNAGSNFELRTPASSNTKINDVDSDGTQEYLCTDTDLIIVTKLTTTAWVAQSITNLGAVRTAVVPD